MEKKKQRMQLKDDYANISGVHIKYFKVEPAVGTRPCLTQPQYQGEGNPGGKLKWRKVLHLPGTCVLFGTETQMLP